ncbi:Ni2+-binding GTPase [Paenibacillus sp. HN-1]|uniref:Ni2+-binding GTPase n=1 Tax=Paenibacillus TaxID=44249 RepID=UPI001CA9B3B2|nr:MULTISPECIES: Ni2+-binding GTPase [Paenibacillus]MBY9081531.1 Ni2+-binding GTPase [Paenibacillus sp. CGMCC 1.18879]MBY9087654.1 Ni2+-binding GTPase [Paenibacillus sinensis]
MAEDQDTYKERMTRLKEKGALPPEAENLMEELLAKLAEAERSNLALRRAALKAAGGQSMSTRLREALYE